jgi:hypothetical protein
MIFSDLQMSDLISMVYKYDIIQSDHSPYSAKVCLTNQLEISESALPYLTEHVRMSALLIFD